MSTMPRSYEGLCIRKLQAVAAICLARFCAVSKISHPAIDQLVGHLLKILVVKDLCAWDKEGSALQITGRGDALPEAVSRVLPEGLLETFTTLVERVVEVGIVDMYGSRTDAPVRFLKECVDILQKAGGTLPPIGEIFPSDGKEEEADGWGLPATEEEYSRAIGMLRQKR